MVFLLVAFFCQCLTLKSHGSPLLGVRGKDSAGLRLPSRWCLGDLETTRHWSGEGGVRSSETVWGGPDTQDYHGCHFTCLNAV